MEQEEYTDEQTGLRLTVDSDWLMPRAKLHDFAHLSTEDFEAALARLEEQAGISLIFLKQEPKN